MLLLIGLGHAALLLALATWIVQPKRALTTVPLAVSLIDATQRAQAPAAQPASPRRPVALPAAPALPIPQVTSEPVPPSQPARAQAEAAPTTPVALPSPAPAVQEASAIHVETPPPTTAAVPQRRRLAASAVQYRVMPPAEVPRTSRRAGESGTVWLRVLVDAEGVPTSVTLQRSSGFARLDEQALWAMRQARFTPHREEGRPVEVEVIAPIEYPPG